MIFIVLVIFIALIVAALNIMDSNNLEKIKNYLEVNECTNIYYGYGSYKALCPKELRVVANSFVLDIAKNEKLIKYDTIAKHKLIKQKIVLTLNDSKKEVLKFKEQSSAKKYNEKIEEIYKNARDN